MDCDPSAAKRSGTDVAIMVEAPEFFASLLEKFLARAEGFVSLITYVCGVFSREHKNKTCLKQKRMRQLRLYGFLGGIAPGRERLPGQPIQSALISFPEEADDTSITNAITGSA